MTKRDSSLNNIKDLIIDSVKQGSEQEEDITDISHFWFHNFYYFRDPLESYTPQEAITETNLSLFVNRKAEIKVISQYIGKARNLPYNIHIAIIGSKGIGKHTTFKIITHFIKDSFPDITLEFYSLEIKYNYKKNETVSQKEINRLDDTQLDVRIISCSGKNKYLFISKINDYKKKTKITFSIWNTRDYPFENDLHVSKEIYFKNYNRNDLIEIFRLRVEKFLDYNQNSKNYKVKIIDELVPKMTEYFQGNLFVCFLFFKEIHYQARIMNLKEIPTPLIDQLIQKYLNIKSQKITTKEQEIIDYYLYNQGNKIYITTSDLKDNLDIDRTVAWKYLENMTKKKMFKKIRYGNPSRYQINDLFLSFYEDQLRKDLVFREKG